MALIYEPKIFAECAGVRAALSLRGTNSTPFGFNMSLSVGDDSQLVADNRARLATRLGFGADRLATLRQVHGDTVVNVDNVYAASEGDAIVTDREGWLLAVSVADCAPILMYDQANRVVAAVHSGWRGTQQNVVEATIGTMKKKYSTNPDEVLCYVGAAASQCCYEVGDDVAQHFDERFSRSIADGKYLFDNKGRVLEQLISCGLQPINIEMDIRCTICDSHFHSYRRDGLRSGRMLAVIGMTTELANSDSLGTA
ncbi:MAG: peptidoglycan editing factor PgeF [bacterium]|nr:peptidoglycan editing factor PgeF [Candidatus Kapabacteria bacterium]